ncbi:MAG: hypothetical protein WD080_13280 [Egibacteraceae bacterium]
MSKRLVAVLMMVLLACAVAAPAMAVEAGGESEELPSYEEVGSGTETSLEFRPEPYEQPTVFAGLLYPLLLLAGVAVIGVLGLYLLWQPRFSEERKAKKRQ